jgi:hypothetical protein
VKRNTYLGRVVTLLAIATGVIATPGCGRESAATYSLDSIYATLPSDDEALGRWLRGHDGWRDATVTRGASEFQVRFGSDQPPSPAAIREVLAECERLGYTGRTHYRGTFSDRSQRGTNWQTLWVEYADLPADDGAITAWLGDQSDVGQPAVRREGKVVVFEFEIGSPPRPTLLADLVRQCGQLGYRGEAGTISAFGRYK